MDFKIFFERRNLGRKYSVNDFQGYIRAFVRIFSDGLVDNIYKYLLMDFKAIIEDF